MISRYFNFGLRMYLFLGFVTGILKSKISVKRRHFLKTLYEIYYFLLLVIIISTFVINVFCIIFGSNFNKIQGYVLSILEALNKSISPLLWIGLGAYQTVYARVYERCLRTCLKAVLNLARRNSAKIKINYTLSFSSVFSTAYFYLFPMICYISSEEKTAYSTLSSIGHTYSNIFLSTFGFIYFHLIHHLSSICEILKENLSTMPHYSKEMTYSERYHNFKLYRKKLLLLKIVTKVIYSYFSQPISLILISNFFYFIFVITSMTTTSNIKGMTSVNVFLEFFNLFGVLQFVVLIVWFSDQINNKVCSL